MDYSLTDWQPTPVRSIWRILMGYHYELHTGAQPFVPASIAFPKKKAKQLKSLLPGLRLNEAQSAIAAALGWKDWFELEQAIGNRTPSALDEDVSDLEARRRYGDQFRAIHDLNVRLPDVELVVAELGLTCLPGTAKKRAEDVGPWGAFQSTPDVIAPGLELGNCAKFSCYRLSKELHDQMPAYLQRKYAGWYMEEDHGWRVVLSFPEHFTEEKLAAAQASFADYEPNLYELVTGKTPDSESVGGFIHPPMALLMQKAQKNPSNWFALSIQPFYVFEGIEFNDSTRKLNVVSAIRGADILELMEKKGVWPETNAPEVRWVGMNGDEVDKLMGVFSGKPILSLNGLKGWELPPIAAYPFADAPFAAIELDLILGKPFIQSITKPTVGVEVVIS